MFPVSSLLHVKHANLVRFSGDSQCDASPSTRPWAGLGCPIQLDILKGEVNVHDNKDDTDASLHGSQKEANSSKTPWAGLECPGDSLRIDTTPWAGPGYSGHEGSLTDEVSLKEDDASLVDSHGNRDAL